MDIKQRLISVYQYLKETFKKWDWGLIFIGSGFTLAVISSLGFIVGYYLIVSEKVEQEPVIFNLATISAVYGILLSILVLIIGFVFGVVLPYYKIFKK
ncbi:MAG: hypothetical protein WCW87_03400 [Candidatus Paceibacterota bacterium]